MPGFDAFRSQLEQAGQSHLLQFADAGFTTPEQMDTLLHQLKNIDFARVTAIFKSLDLDQQRASQSAGDYNPIVDVAGLSSSRHDDTRLWRQEGLQAIADGKIAAVVLSGGQGTRLGFNGPKGLYDIGLPSRKSILQIIAERIRRLTEISGSRKSLPLYVMTSPLNHETIKAFFEENMYFGLGSDNVYLFQQGTMPCFDFEGKILLDTPGTIAQAPDGNGGIYSSLEASGALADMERRGIQAMHVCAVDNVLVKIADPVFIGYCMRREADCGNKVVWKAKAEEKVGVVVKRHGKPCVVEYSEMDHESMHKVDERGKLVYGAGNICSHYFTVAFIKTKVLRKLCTMYHAARKKIPHVIYPDTNPVHSERENGIKLESFIFDVFPLSENMALWEVAREDDFAPVKDAPGGPGDTPEKARGLLSDEAERWVREAGGRLIAAKGTAECSEISPLVSYSGEGLEGRVKGREIQLPIRFLS